MDKTTEDPLLDEEQARRADALRTARGVLVKSQVFGSAELTASTFEVVDLAHYILTGWYPYGAERDQPEKDVGDVEVPEAAHA